MAISRPRLLPLGGIISRCATHPLNQLAILRRIADNTSPLHLTGVTLVADARLPICWMNWHNGSCSSVWHAHLQSLDRDDLCGCALDKIGNYYNAWSGSGEILNIHGEASQMAEGIIKRLTSKGFGFIDTGNDKDLFFHSSNVDGVSYESLHEGQTDFLYVGTRPERARSPKRLAGVTARDGPRQRLIINSGRTNMGDKGSKDKGKREKQKKAQLSPKEKRQRRNEKKSNRPR